MKAMKRTNWLIIVLAFCMNARAQEKLVLAGTPPAQYVGYTITAETNLKTVSNHFGQSAAKLAAFNKLNANAPLTKGMVIKIPVTKYNLLRAKVSDKNLPVYHIVAKGDNLYRLSKINGITVANLRDWNKLKTDAVKVGEPLIVAFMANVKATDLAVADKKKDEPKKADETQPVTTQVATTPKSEEPEKKVVEEKQHAAPVTKPLSNEVAPAVAEPAKTVAALTPVVKESNRDYVPREGDEGYFAAGYAQHPREKTQQFHSGDAATFKTISGWSDRKYYVLINDLAPETIVRITGPNNKSVCAKVLGPLQETKGGNGLLLRMSNSAASALGITDPKFTVTVTYFE
jgi:LysM repeat protein